jgi:OFA family oxalate/formate antiporter-like MFS transporter
VPYGFAEGMFSGGAFAMLPVIYADYFGRQSIGAIRGITHPVVMVANAAGPLLAGVIFDLRGDYSLAFQIFGAVTLIGATLVWFAKPPRVPPDTGGGVDSLVEAGDTGAEGWATDTR